jgi:cyclopropane fatty-acyl-phospholipid synthase-like methyltransferase
MSSSNPVAQAEAYYDSSDADAFYSTIWGGNDIHIGIYENPDDDIALASHRTVEHMASMLPALSKHHRIIDLGAGYGGSARFLAGQVGCHVTCLNLSETQNESNRRLTTRDGMADRVQVLHGSFEDIPEPDDSFDVIWSQDAILHSGDRLRVLDEASRVLRTPGHFIFTDPMQSDACPQGVLQPILDRIHLNSLGCPAFYRAELGKRGFEERGWLDLTHQMRTHYARVGATLRDRYDEMVERCSHEYVDNMLQGLNHWVVGADKGHLTWGIFHFARPDAE